MLNQKPEVFSFTTTANQTKTKISDMMGVSFDHEKRYTSFILRLKDESDSDTIFFVGDSDVSKTNKKGVVGSGDSGKFGGVTEELNMPAVSTKGLKLDDYYVAHDATATEFVLIVY